MILEAKRIQYEFDIKRNITIIQGDSATGKTTLIGLLSEYSLRGGATGIQLTSDVPCVVYNGGMGRWEDELKSATDSIVFIDEGFPFIRSKDFARVIASTSNYYVLVTREPLMEIPYSVNEIYGIRTSGKYHYPEKIYNEFYPIYSDIGASDAAKSNRLLIVEDSKSGFQFFSSVRGEKNCISAEGNANIIGTLLSHHDRMMSVMADGAAFGAYIEEVVLFAKEYPETVLYFPESFEWMVLKSGVIKPENIDDIMENPEDYIESSEYISWERFFTHLLEEQTEDDPIRAYKKQRLADYYKEGRNQRRIMDVIPDIIRDYF